jgi:hypothetical protein
MFISDIANGLLDQQYSIFFVRFEVFTAVTLKNGVFWDVMLCGSCHPDEGSAKFLRNVISYRSHTA